MNVIELTGWYEQPIHCPFCGAPHTPPDISPCRHMLYIIFGENFMFRSDRFDLASGVSKKDNEWWPEFSSDDVKKYGKPLDVVKATAEKFSNFTEYQVDSISDTAHIGYANLEAEICGWGLNHISPYAR
jgi:hypothetical protein